MSTASALSLVVLAALNSVAFGAQMVRFKDRCVEDLVLQVPKILASQNPETGRFGTGIWIVTDQNVMLPLAATWSYRHEKNPYYHNAKVLDSIMAAGDALIADQDASGQWEFRKKDGSTWGQIYMPWTYSRWMRAFALVRDAMPEERRARWEKALKLGFGGIDRLLAETKEIRNIPAHDAMALYFAGKVFDNPAWRKQAAAFLHRVAAAQHPDGYWSEHVGPVVKYGVVYVDALGTYFAASKDEAIRPALRKAALFHARFTYPDGADVETVDERNPYGDALRLPNLGFTFTPEGRSYFARQVALRKAPLPADEAASLLLWGEEGKGERISPAASDFDYVLPSGDAAVRRRGPWLLVASAITAPISTSRWIQDRQNFVSVYHDKIGLVLGGGNTKLQPAWSNFTIGDTGLLRHRPGDEKPVFLPPPGILHVPDSARLIAVADRFGVELQYGGHRGTIALKVLGANRLEYVVSGDSTMVAHLTVFPHMNDDLLSASGKKASLEGEGFVWDGADWGGWIEHRKARIHIPPDASVRWPALPHNPYRKDGSATPSEGRIVIDIPPSAEARVLTLEIQ